MSADQITGKTHLGYCSRCPFPIGLVCYHWQQGYFLYWACCWHYQFPERCWQTCSVLCTLSRFPPVLPRYEKTKRNKRHLTERNRSSSATCPGRRNVAKWWHYRHFALWGASAAHRQMIMDGVCLRKEWFVASSQSLNGFLRDTDALWHCCEVRGKKISKRQGVPLRTTQRAVSLRNFTLYTCLRSQHVFPAADNDGNVGRCERAQRNPIKHDLNSKPSLRFNWCNYFTVANTAHFLKSSLVISPTPLEFSLANLLPLNLNQNLKRAGTNCCTAENDRGKLWDISIKYHFPVIVLSAKIWTNDNHVATDPHQNRSYSTLENSPSKTQAASCYTVSGLIKREILLFFTE